MITAIDSDVHGTVFIAWGIVKFRDGPRKYPQHRKRAHRALARLVSSKA